MKRVFNDCHFFIKEGKYFIFVVSNLRLYELDKDSYEKIYGIYNNTIDFYFNLLYNLYWIIII